MTELHERMCSEAASVGNHYDRPAMRWFLKWWERMLGQGRMRECAVRHLGSISGCTVLDVACNTGQNIPYLRDAVGNGGTVLAFDCAPVSLSIARNECERRGWNNVRFDVADARDYRAPQPLDGILLGLCFNVLGGDEMVLRNLIEQLRPGKKVVILEAAIPTGIIGFLFGAAGKAIARILLRADANVQPREVMRRLDDLVSEVEIVEFRGSVNYLLIYEKK